MFGFKKLTDEEKAAIEKARQIDSLQKELLEVSHKRSELKQQALQLTQELDKLLGE